MITTDTFAFIHIPKTGGSSVVCTCSERQLLTRLNSRPHCPIDELDDELRGLIGVLPTFAGVRNPLTWYPSWFHHSRTVMGRSIEALLFEELFLVGGNSVAGIVGALDSDQLDPDGWAKRAVEIMRSADVGALTWYFLSQTEEQYLKILSASDIVDAYLELRSNKVQVYRQEQLRETLAPYIDLEGVRVKPSKYKSEQDRSVSPLSAAGKTIFRKERLIFSLFYPEVSECSLTR